MGTLSRGINSVILIFASVHEAENARVWCAKINNVICINNTEKDFLTYMYETEFILFVALLMD